MMTKKNVDAWVEQLKSAVCATAQRDGGHETTAFFLIERGDPATALPETLEVPPEVQADWDRVAVGTPMTLALPLPPPPHVLAHTLLRLSMGEAECERAWVAAEDTARAYNVPQADLPQALLATLLADLGLSHKEAEHAFVLDVARRTHARARAQVMEGRALFAPLGQAKDDEDLYRRARATARRYSRGIDREPGAKECLILLAYAPTCGERIVYLPVDRSDGALCFKDEADSGWRHQVDERITLFPHQEAMTLN